MAVLALLGEIVFRNQELAGIGGDLDKQGVSIFGMAYYLVFDSLQLVAILAGQAFAGQVVDSFNPEHDLVHVQQNDALHVLPGPSMLPSCAILELAAEVASLRSTVLIQGESGTGKELIARAIHTSGDRAQKPFVAVSCAALAETLLESELFGHEKGSFTGATEQKRGKFEMANGGTIFLDEIGDISPKLQVDLLRVLQERCFYRVGGSEEVRVDVRVIAATHVNLQVAVSEGKFRDDLFYRLNVIEIRIPPPRERREDVPLLARHFMERLSHELGKDIGEISEGALKILIDYNWPGNVRELENAVERA